MNKQGFITRGCSFPFLGGLRPHRGDVFRSEMPRALRKTRHGEGFLRLPLACGFGFSAGVPPQVAPQEQGAEFGEFVSGLGDRAPE